MTEEEVERMLAASNRNLPDCYRPKLLEESSRLEEEVLRLVRDDSTSTSEIQLRKLCRRLSDFKSLSYFFSESSRVEIARYLWSITVEFPVPLPIGTRCRLINETAAFLEPNQPCLPRLDSVLILPWRPLVREVAKIFGIAELEPESEAEEAERGHECAIPEGQSSNRLARAFSALCSNARGFLGPDAAQQLHASIRPKLSKLDSALCFEAAALLSCLAPSKENAIYSAENVSEWISLWSQIDFSPSWDSMWLRVLFRARRYGKGFNASSFWTSHLPRIVSLTQRCLKGAFCNNLGASEHHYPPPRRSKMIVSLLAGVDSRHVDPKMLAYLLVSLMGLGEENKAVNLRDSLVRLNVPLSEEVPQSAIFGDFNSARISEGTSLVLRLLRSTRVHFHPSNMGHWSAILAPFLDSFTSQLAYRVGYENAELPSDLDGSVKSRLNYPGPHLSHSDVQAALGVLLPLVHELIYSKKRTLGYHGERSLRSLASISPRIVAEESVPLLMRALDPVDSINYVHQAPSALSALSHVMDLLLLPNPWLASLLHQLLEWALPGVDPNDLAKSLSALEFFRITLQLLADDKSRAYSPFSVGRKAANWFDEGALKVAYNKEEVDEALLEMEDFKAALPSFSLALLERMLLLIEHRGELVKHVSSRVDQLAPDGDSHRSSALHSAAGVGRDLLLTKALGFVCAPLFACLGSEIVPAVRLISTFVRSSPPGSTAKDASSVIQSAVRSSPSIVLREIVPVLLDDLSQCRSDAVAYRIRLLAGAVRFAGTALLEHITKVKHCLEKYIKSEERVLCKAACKLLRHTLHCLAEQYPMGSTAGGVLWHAPTTEELQVACSLVEEYGITSLEMVAQSEHLGGSEKVPSLEMCRSLLRAAKYSLRGVVRCESNDVVAVESSIELDIVLKSLSHLRKLGIALLRSFRLHVSSELWRSKCPDSKLARMVLDIGRLSSIVRGPSRTKVSSEVAFYRARIRHSGASQLAYGARAARLDILDESAPFHVRSYIVEHSQSTSSKLMEARAVVQHLLRQDIASMVTARRLRHREDIRGCLNDFLSLSRHSHAVVRGFAQISIATTAVSFGHVLEEEIVALLTSLSTEDSYSAVTGSLYLLAENHTLKRGSASYGFIDALLRFLCESNKIISLQTPDHQEKMATRIQLLFKRYIYSAAPPPLSGGDVPRLRDLLAYLISLVGLDERAREAPLHWRLSLMVHWFIIHLIKRAVECELDLVDSGMWQLFIQGLVQAGDGQPSQDLCLSGLGLMLIAGRKQPDYSSGRPILIQFMKEDSQLLGLIRALIHSHSEAYSSERGKQWSLGVAEILSDASAKLGTAIEKSFSGVHPSGRLLSENSSTDLLEDNAFLVRMLVEAWGDDKYTWRLLACAQKCLGEATADEKSIYRGALIEVVAGIIMAYTRVGQLSAGCSGMWSLVLPVIEESIDNASPESATEWSPAIRVCFTGLFGWDGQMEPLMLLLQKRALDAAEAKDLYDTYSHHSKWLSLIPSVIGEIPRVRALEFIRAVGTYLASACGSPFKSSRREVGLCLTAMLTVACLHPSDFNLASDMMDVMVATCEVEETIVDESARALSLVSVKDGDGHTSCSPASTNGVFSAASYSTEKTAEERRSMSRETVIICLTGVIAHGDAAIYFPVISRLLPIALDALADPAIDTCKLARMVLPYLARMVHASSRDQISSISDGTRSVLSIITNKTKSSLWQVRQGSMEFYGAFWSSHMLAVLSVSDQALLLSTCLALLEDERREVQEMARSALTLYLSQCSGKDATLLAREYTNRSLEESEACQKRRRLLKKSGGTHHALARAKNEKGLESTVLVLASLVHSAPYDIPDFLPAAIVALGAHRHSQNALVKENVAVTFKEFRRTRTGVEWHDARNCFTPQQLEIFDDLVEIPSYFS